MYSTETDHGISKWMDRTGLLVLQYNYVISIAHRKKTFTFDETIMVEG